MNDLRKHVRSKHPQVLTEATNKKRKHDETQFNPAFPSIPSDLRDLISGVSKLDSAVANNAILPFLWMLRNPHPVTRISDEHSSTEGVDGTTPIHWAIGDLITLSRRASRNRVIEDLFTASSSKFLSGHLVHPIDESNDILNIRLICQIATPDPNSKSLLYAANIRGRLDISPVQMPTLLHKMRHFDIEEVASYSSNLTPKGTVVDLHRGTCRQACLSTGLKRVDRVDVFSVCTDWKVWGFWPPSEHNTSLFETVSKGTNRLLHLYEKLQGGQCVLCGPLEGCYIPAGYFHSTYAFEGGATIGTSWSSAEALPAAMDMLVTELTPYAEIRVSTQNDVVYFLRSLVQAISRRGFEESKTAMQRICPEKMKLDKPGPLLGPGWALAGAYTENRKLFKTIQSGVLASRYGAEFWSCDEQQCRKSVLAHISEGEVNQRVHKGNVSARPVRRI